jgi:hypothetical protein
MEQSYARLCLRRFSFEAMIIVSICREREGQGQAGQATHGRFTLRGYEGAGDVVGYKLRPRGGMGRWGWAPGDVIRSPRHVRGLHVYWPPDRLSPAPLANRTPVLQVPVSGRANPFPLALSPPFPPRRVHASLFRLTDTPGGRELLRVMADPDGLPDKQGPPLHCLGAPLPSTPPMHPASRGGPSVPPRVYTQHEEVKQDDETGEPPHAIPDTCNITLDVRYRHEFMSLQVCIYFLCVHFISHKSDDGASDDFYLPTYTTAPVACRGTFPCVCYSVYYFSWFSDDQMWGVDLNICI